MKTIITYTLATLLAALVFYGGAGVNFVSYCCDDCRSEGVETVIYDKCCEIHEHRHDTDHLHTDGSLCAECESLCDTDCCTMERVDFEWDQPVNTVFNLQPAVIDLLPSALLPKASLLSASDAAETLISGRDGPPLAVLPKVYLSLLTTLLI